MFEHATTRARGRGHPLLSGLVLCGRCGARLCRSKANGHSSYRCPGPPGGCGNLGIRADRLEDWMLTMVEWRRRRPDQDPEAARPHEAGTGGQQLLEYADSLRSL